MSAFLIKVAYAKEFYECYGMWPVKFFFESPDGYASDTKTFAIISINRLAAINGRYIFPYFE